MADVPTATTCPRCSSSARRAVTTVRTGHGSSAAMTAMDSARRSASEPSVISSVPGASRRSTPTSSNPLHRKLPRP
ncbi:zinc ribbon domain-containing protein [Actinomycetes bacterium M1A6_2h]